MQLKSQISAVIALAALIWGIYLYFSGQDLSWKMVAPFGVTVSGVTLISIAFIKHLWRWNIFRRWLVERPDIAGTWKGRLKSSYTEGGQPVEKTVFVVIRQTLTSLSFRLYSEKARSFSLADSLSKDEPDLFKLAVAYQNVPNVEYPGVDSEIHYGAALFTHID